MARYINVGIVFIALSGVIFPVTGQEKTRKVYELHEQAESLFNDGDFGGAIELLDECLKINPGYMAAYSLRAPAREQLNDLDGALTDYSIYLEKFPDHLDVLLGRAVLRYRIGFYEQAREDFLKLLTLPPPEETNALFFKKSMSVDDLNPVVTTTHGAHTSYLYNYLGLTEAKLKNYEQARKHFDEAIRLNAYEPDYFVNRGLVRESMNDSTAFLDYEMAVRLNPNHPLANHNLKAWQARKQQPVSVEERLTQTIQSDSTMLYPYLERAQQRYESKYYEGALDDYNMALRIDSTDVEIWLGRGLVKEKLKDLKGAFSDYTKAIDLKENFAKAWLNRGNVLLKQERFGDAIEDYNVALIYYPDYAIAFYNRAMAKFRLKKFEEACADLRQAGAFGMSVDEKVMKKVCK